MAITKQELGNRLRQLRESRGYSQEDVSEILGISRSAVVQLEAGNRSLDSVELMMLAQEFGFDPKQLFEESFDAVQDSVTALFRSDAQLATNKELTRAVSECRTCADSLRVSNDWLAPIAKLSLQRNTTCLPPGANRRQFSRVP